MGSLIKLARREIPTLEPCKHGGEVLEVARTERKKPEEILDFSANTNPLGPSPKALVALRDNLKQISFYPDPASFPLRLIIARKLGISTGNIIIGNGSTELIRLFAEVFIERGDEALIPAPTFGEYEIAVRKAGGKINFLKLDPAGFCIKADEVVGQFRKRTKILFFCNPNNPTGQLIKRKDMLKIVKEASQRNILVFIDESFMDFVNGNERFTLIRDVRAHPNLFVLRSLTKTFGLPGLRVGYGAGCEEMIELLHRAKTPWNVNVLAQIAAVAALGDDEYMVRARQLIVREREYLSRGFTKFKHLRVFPSDTNFLLLDIRGTGMTATQLKKELLRYGILIRDCSPFRGLDEYFVRIAVRRRKENARLLKALGAILKSERWTKRHINEVLKAGRVLGENRACKYYPCHFDGQDCTWCFCPFYPCKEKSTGGEWVKSGSGVVWSCQNCWWVHQPEVARQILEELLKIAEPLEKISRKKLIGIRLKILEGREK